MPRDCTTHITSLPDEILLLIFDHTSPRDLLKCGRVCQHWARVSRDKSLWTNQHDGRERMLTQCLQTSHAYRVLIQERDRITTLVDLWQSPFFSLREKGHVTIRALLGVALMLLVYSAAFSTILPPFVIPAIGTIITIVSTPWLALNLIHDQQQPNQQRDALLRVICWLLPQPVAYLATRGMVNSSVGIIPQLLALGFVGEDKRSWQVVLHSVPAMLSIGWLFITSPANTVVMMLIFGLVVWRKSPSEREQLPVKKAKPSTVDIEEIGFEISSWQCMEICCVLMANEFAATGILVTVSFIIALCLLFLPLVIGATPHVAVFKNELPEHDNQTLMAMLAWVKNAR